MRAYVDGQLSEVQKDSFFIVSLWFANEDSEDNMEISENCFRLDGIFTESTSDVELFSSRWKGVTLCYINEDGVYTETEDFTLEFLDNMIKEKNMRVVNADGYPSVDVTATIKEFKLVDGENELVIDPGLIDEIEFIV